MEDNRKWLKRLSDLPARTEEEERIDNYGVHVMLESTQREMIDELLRRPTEEWDRSDYALYREQQEERKKRGEEQRVYNRDLYLKRKAKKEEQVKALNLQVSDIPVDVLAAIELDSRRYREMRIAAALRRIGEAKLTRD